MRTNEERIAALHRRAAELEKEERSRLVRWITAAAAVVCLGVVVLLAVLLPGLSGRIAAGELQGSMNASMFADAAVIGYLVIGIVAFLLGVAVTIFCFRLKKWQEEQDRDTSEEEG